MQDAVARKMTENRLVFIAGSIFSFLVFTPLVLSLWRFALYGLE